MMSKEEIGAAYEKGYWSVYDQRVNNWEEAQLTGLIEVARQQAEHDAQLVAQFRGGYNRNGATHAVLTKVIALIQETSDTVAPVKPWGNPRTPEEAQHEYYLVPASMNLRYAPQYADVSLNDLDDALLAQAALESRGLKYSVYNRSGRKVWTTSESKITPPPSVADERNWVDSK